ncbi:hypothetical protein VKT23_009657 [Stygiomarasmius scandens]|uniref:Uncharacterized protein n=1 Tax=Marasmiellus scandens TaxID=2682957 RepID=A0ABR1JFC7_9AGAR
MTPTTIEHDFPKELLSSLKNGYWGYRAQAIKMIVEFVEDANFSFAVKPSILQILTMAAKDEDEDVRATGVRSLVSLVQKGL